jgi:hypothetical protein
MPGYQAKSMRSNKRCHWFGSSGTYSWERSCLVAIRFRFFRIGDAAVGAS